MFSQLKWTPPFLRLVIFQINNDNHTIKKDNIAFPKNNDVYKKNSLEKGMAHNKYFGTHFAVIIYRKKVGANHVVPKSFYKKIPH